MATNYAYVFGGSMNGISPWAKAQAGIVRDRILATGKVRPQKYKTVAGFVGMSDDWDDSLTFMPSRFHAVKADDVPSKFKSESRRLYKVVAAASYRFHTAASVTEYQVEEKDRLVVDGRTFDVLGVEDSPGGDELLIYIYVAEVV